MHEDDPDKRIAELEHQLAEQKRIAELELQLAEAKGVYPRRADPPGFGGQAGSGPYQPANGELAPRSRATERNWVLRAIVLVGLPVGAVVSFITAAYVGAVFPSTVQWMNGIVCRNGYQLASKSSGYSTPSGGSGTSWTFRCVRGASWYEPNGLAVIGLQALLFMLVLCAAVAVGVGVWRLLRR